MIECDNNDDDVDRSIDYDRSDDDDFVYNYLDVRKEVGGISSVYVHMLYTPLSMTYHHDLYHIISHNISPSALNSANVQLSLNNDNWWNTCGLGITIYNEYNDWEYHDD